MPNPYTYQRDVRWTEGDSTTKPRMDLARINTDHLHDALNKVIDSDDSEGLKGGETDPLLWKINATTVATIAWWEDSQGNLWLIGRRGEHSTLDKDDADFYFSMESGAPSWD